MYYLGCTYFVYNWLSIFLNKIIIFILYTLQVCAYVTNLRHLQTTQEVQPLISKMKL